MKRLVLTALTILLFLCAVRGQSTAEVKFRLQRPDMKLYFTAIDIKKFIGYWISLSGDSMLKIYQSGDEILISGDYFPGVEKYGDKAVLLAGKGTNGYFIGISYTLSTTGGVEGCNGVGGGGSVPIVYSPTKDQLIVGPPAYKFMKDGQCGVSGGGSYFDKENKEFRRVK